VAAAGAGDVATFPPASPEMPQVRAPTAAEGMEATRAEPGLPPVAAEPAPALFVRSGGTVLAPPHEAAPMPMPTPMPGAAASMSHGAMPMATSMPGAAASMSHGSVPIVPPASGVARFDPLGVSSPGLPAMGPAAYASGAHPHTGAYAPLPGPRRSEGRRAGLVIVVALLVVTWIVIGAMWLSSRNEAIDAAPAAPAPAPTGAGDGPGGLYRFADDPDPAPAVGGPVVLPTDAAGETKPSGTPATRPTLGRETKGRGETEGKGKIKKDKKPKRFDDD
jgi:hypothetical protein